MAEAEVFLERDGERCRGTGAGEGWREVFVPSRHPLLWITLAALPLFLVDLRHPALNDGEAMYAEIAREMRLLGDWITPHLNGNRHFDKPPFLYWLIAIGQALLGETEFAARIWPALSAWLTIPVVGALGTTLYNPKAGCLAALVFATCVGPYIFGRMAMPDPILILWISLAILGYVRGIVRDGGKGPWYWAFFACLGMASLTKGILGFGLPSAIVGLHILLSGRLRSVFSRRLPAGAALTGAIGLPWLAAAGRANPDFLGYFLIREHVLRFTGQRYPPDEFLALPVFLSLTLIWTFPWVTLVPQALWRSGRRLFNATWRRSADLLPLLWMTVIIGLFSASHSRLEYYALPSIPAFALLIGKLWDELLQEGPEPLSNRGPVAALGVLTLLLGMAAVGAFAVLGPANQWVFQTFLELWPESGWVAGPEQIGLLNRIRIPTLITAAGMALGLMGALFALKRLRARVALGLLAGMTVPLFIMVQWGFLVTEPFMSVRPIAEIVRLEAGPDDIVVYQEPHEYMWVGGLTYYTKRMVHILKDPKFDGVSARRREPPERFLDRRGFLDLWHSGRRVLLVADEHGPVAARMSEVRPLRVIARMGGRVVFINQRIANTYDKS